MKSILLNRIVNLKSLLTRKLLETRYMQSIQHKHYQIQKIAAIDRQLNDVEKYLRLSSNSPDLQEEISILFSDKLTDLESSAQELELLFKTRLPSKQDEVLHNPPEAIDRSKLTEVSVEKKKAATNFLLSELMEFKGYKIIPEIDPDSTKEYYGKNKESMIFEYNKESKILYVENQFWLKFMSLFDLSEPYVDFLIKQCAKDIIGLNPDFIHNAIIITILNEDCFDHI